MAQPVQDSFLDLERHRQRLEENIVKLRKSMVHWQIWEAEYEGLKEEILDAKSTPTREMLLAIARDYGGQLVTQKELEDILGVKEARTAAQVVNVLDRRIDYVEQNVRTIEKQIAAAQDKLAAASIVSTPDVRNEEGLPLTEITEELDDEGNVVSGHLSTPGSAKSQLLEVLEKAGVKDLLPPQTTTEPQSTATSKPSAEHEYSSSPDNIAAKPIPKSKKKGVKFAEDTKPGPSVEKSKTAKRLEDIMKIAKQQETPPPEPPIIPTSESPEDAALRRAMLQYGMSEIGSVVAELELEDGSDWTDDGYNETSTDDEDAFGRSTEKVIDDQLRQQMMELEERLGVRAMQNVGKIEEFDGKDDDFDIVEEGIGRITIKGQDEVISDAPTNADHAPGSATSKAATSAKKSVRFSQNLDVSPAPIPPPAAALSKTPTVAAPVGDVIERTAPAQTAASAPQKKASRFKSARTTTSNVLNGPLALSNNPQSAALPLYPAKSSTPKPFSRPITFSPVEDQSRTVPTGPEGQVLAPTIVERDTPVSTSVPEPDDLDPRLLHQEVATEYHKVRNRMIQKQGGFVKEEESAVVPFTEDEGGPRRVSRFKAARLAGL